jgi:hypothetical protein
MTDPRQQSAQREHAIDVTVLAMTDGRHFLTVADQRRVAGKYLDRILAECPALFAAQPPQGETREPVAYARERRFPGRTGWEFERVDRDPKDAELHTLPHYEYRTLPLFAERPQESPEPRQTCGHPKEEWDMNYCRACWKGYDPPNGAPAPDAGKLSLSSPDETRKEP